MFDIGMVLFQLWLLIIGYYMFYLVIKNAVKNDILETRKAMESKKTDTEKEERSGTLEQ